MVQALLSVQAAVVWTKLQPVAGTQMSCVHGLPSLHTTLAPPSQPPSTHKSALVQAFPSVQLSAFALYMQPETGEQLSVEHGLPSSQLVGLPGRQTPLPQ